MRTAYPIHPKIVPHPAEDPNYQPVRRDLMRIGRDFPYVSAKGYGSTQIITNSVRTPDKFHITGKVRDFDPKARMGSIDGKAYCDMTQKQLEDLFTSSIVPQAKNFLKEGGNTTMSQIGYGNVPRINPPKVPKGERPGITEVNPVKDYKNTAVCSDFPRYCTTTSGAELFKDGTYDEMLAATRKDDGITKLPVMFQPNLALLNYRPGLGYTDLDKVVFGEAMGLKKQNILQKIRASGLDVNPVLEELLSISLLIDDELNEITKKLGFNDIVKDDPVVQKVLKAKREEIEQRYKPDTEQLKALLDNYEEYKTNIDIAKELGLISNIKETEKITIDVIRGRKQAVKPESITEGRAVIEAKQKEELRLKKQKQDIKNAKEAELNLNMMRQQYF